MKAGIMKSCLFLVIVVPFLVTIPLDSEGGQYGGVVRIHFDLSPSPDLTTIQDTYFGEEPFICAHVVIDSMPSGFVSAYHLDLELISRDSSVVVLGGFHPRPGWEFPSPDDEFPPARPSSASRTPTSVGYWRLWLREGRESEGQLIVKGLLTDDYEGILLVDHEGTRLLARAAYPGAVNSEPSARTPFDHVPVLPEDGWEAVPQLDPLWVLAVEDDSARVVANEFQGSQDRSAGIGEFPVRSVQLRRYWMEDLGEGRWRFFCPQVLKTVNENGSLQDEAIEWLPELEANRERSWLSVSREARFAVVSSDGETSIVSYDGGTVSKLQQETVWASCHDVPRRIVAVAREQIEVGGHGTVLYRLSVLDYSGNLLYRSELTDCEFTDCAVSRDGGHVVFKLSGCHEAGAYLLRLGDGSVFSLARIPEGGWRFSPDFRHLLVNKHGEFAIYSTGNPEFPSLLWRTKLASELRDIAISDGAELIAYRVRSPRERLPYIYVISGIDGRPLAVLRMSPSRPATGPLVFVGRFLFAGAHFSSYGASSNTDHIYLFGLHEASMSAR
jgi:hypothetical protein